MSQTRHGLIAGGRNRYTELKARIPFLDINQERELTRQLALAMESPVWEAVRKPVPGTEMAG